MKRRNFLLKIFSLSLALVMIAGSLAGCKKPVDIDDPSAASGAVQDYPVVVNEVTINAKPTKVAVLSGNLADVMIAVGYETSLAIATEDCTQPELQTLPKAALGDNQAIIDAEADLILAESFTADQTAAFSEASIPMITIAPAANREDFERIYTQVGSVLNGAGTGYGVALTAAQRIFTTLDDLSRIIPEKDTVTTGCFLLDLQSSAVTGDMLGSTLLSYAGITNVFKGATGGTYEFEKLKVTDPDYIFCPEGLAAQMKSNPNFSKLSAVMAGKVIELPANHILWQGRTVITAATAFASAAYPELMEETSTAATLPKEVAESEAASKAAAEGDKGESSAKTESSNDSADESSAASKYTAIKRGSNDDDVLKMQDRLHELGFLTAEYSGLYGDTTAKSIEAFQKANGLEETGDADPDTLAALYSDKAKKAP